MGASSINRHFLYRARAEVASHSTAGIESIRYVQLPEMNKINRLKKNVWKTFLYVYPFTRSTISPAVLGASVYACVWVCMCLSSRSCFSEVHNTKPCMRVFIAPTRQLALKRIFVVNETARQTRCLSLGIAPRKFRLFTEASLHALLPTRVYPKALGDAFLNLCSSSQPLLLFIFHILFFLSLSRNFPVSFSGSLMLFFT